MGRDRPAVLVEDAEALPTGPWRLIVSGLGRCVELGLQGRSGGSARASAC